MKNTMLEDHEGVLAHMPAARLYATVLYFVVAKSQG